MTIGARGSGKAGLGGRCGSGSGGSGRRGSSKAGLGYKGWLQQEKAAASAGSQDSGGRVARACGLERQRSRGSRGSSGGTEGGGLKGTVTKNEKGL